VVLRQNIMKPLWMATALTAVYIRQPFHCVSSGSCGREYEDGSFVGCSTVYSHGSIPTIQRCVLSSSWQWGGGSTYALLKHSPSMRLHSNTSLKAVIFNHSTDLNFVTKEMGKQNRCDGTLTHLPPIPINRKSSATLFSVGYTPSNHVSYWILTQQLKN
jgi:hypothetical protein